ncbi:MAG TPA: bacteriohopanetetrol glucosamine biosynthesis glycosyltransferase HpnI [Acidobacteriaceae bacterium]|jgi:ceramide glucosyltransferase|nr:bacteriohopanetetrol glucosamine biosynthesis glycosyltransferase HpnI [Acidobacteriaceae bacterium]
MPTFALVIVGMTTLLTLAGLAYYVIALWAARAYLRRPRFPAGPFAPPITILKPVHGLDPGLAEAFASHCRQQYTGDYELIFGVSSLLDPAVPLVRQLQADFPDHAIRLVLCPDVLGPNGKVSNLAQMVPHARFDLLVINDADIRVSPHYLAHVAAPFAPDANQSPTGLVTSLYRGHAHGTIPSKLEALGIATDFAPGVLTARLLDRGLRFGLGSTLAVSRRALDAIGGFEILGDALADDYELGARIVAAGFRVDLADQVVETSVPAWSFSGYFRHQLRWARTMRDSRRAGYAGLLFSYGLAWAILNLVASGFSLFALALFSLALFARVSIALGIGVGILEDRQVLRDLWLVPLRDLLALAVWAWSYASDTIDWRGEQFTLKDGKLTRRTPEASAASTAPAREQN